MIPYDERANEILFDLPLQYWNCNRLISSRNSGYVLALGRVNGIHYAFQCIKPDEAFSGLNQYIVVMKESDELKILNSAELNNVFEDMAQKAAVTTEKQATADMILPFHAILSMKISPDGYYALLLTAEAGITAEATATRHLYLVRLSDMTMKKVSGVDPHSILAGSLGANYKPIMEWSADTILINTTEGIGDIFSRQIGICRFDKLNFFVLYKLNLIFIFQKPDGRRHLPESAPWLRSSWHSAVRPTAPEPSDSRHCPAHRDRPP